MIYLGENRVSQTAQVRWTLTLFLAPWRRQDARCLEGSKRIPAMKSPLFLCIFLVALSLSLCTSSPCFPYARSAAPAVSYPSDAQGAQTSEAVMARSSSDVVIPGPLRSFLRMAGISQKVSPEEVLPLLARNVFAQGYQGWHGRGGRNEVLI